MRGIGLTLATLLLLGATTSLFAAPPDPRPFEEQPYLGLSVRDAPDGGLVVAWVLPGPLGGTGNESAAGVRRADNVVTLDGQRVDAAGFKAALVAKKPGQSVTLVLRRSPSANPDAAVPVGGPGGEERTLTSVLAARSEWAGTIGRGLGTRSVPAPREGAFEAELLARAGEHGLRAAQEGVGGGLDALLARLAQVQEDALDPNASAWVVNAFRRPLSLDALESDLYAALVPAQEATPTRIAAVLRAVLDLSGQPGDPRAAAGRLRALAQARDGLPALQRLVRRHRDEVSPFGPYAAEHIRVLGVSVGPRVTELLGDVLSLLAQGPEAWEQQGREHAGEAPLPALPAELEGSVDGEVLWAGKDALGRLAVVGGAGPNRYQMANVGAVYDIGGNDTYTYSGSTYAALRVVIDIAGDDRHESVSDVDGPATAVLGLSWLEDRAGDDVYTSDHQFSLAAGLCGVGVLIDRAGDDTYTNAGPGAGWAMGIGWYGAGLLLDLAGSDTYRGELLAQGVGGPRGLGLLLDVSGHDRYQADGPSFPSAYGTPGVHVGMSQGFGYGVRGYAAGGVGVLLDLDGDDRYQAGEFSQAGGYYFGLGVLHDRRGRDLYHGNRYGQAFAAHQAVGILVDDEGDDTYWSMTAASQAGTWDESLGLLLDRAGNDSYRCDGLGQGAASMQALAVLVDLHGSDRYTGRGGSVQGQSGGNSYHYTADKVFSFSALLDFGSSVDVYSTSRANDSVTRTGAFNPAAPQDSDLYGLFVDR